MRQHNMSGSFDDYVVNQLRDDPEFAAIYLNEAFATMDDPTERAVSLLAIRHVAEAYGGLRKVAEEADISRESLYRALSPKGNPTLNTLLAVTKAMGMRLSVQPVAADAEHKDLATAE